MSTPDTEATSACPHCGQPAEPGTHHSPFCCRGCREVYALLRDEGLTRYYALAGEEVVAPTTPVNERSHAWLEPLIEEANARPGPLSDLELDVQGIHCAGCVWLMNELFRRRPGAVSITVNPALGRMRVVWERSTFDLPAFVREVERFGYLFGPPSRRMDRGSRDLALRLGICAALSMNVMMFSAAFYTGLAPSDGVLFDLFSRLSLVLSTAVVAIGGWPFFKSTVHGLRRGVLHLDLPIAAGILLVFVTSLIKARDGRGDLAYFDTLDIFVTLMLVGRWLQQRVLEKNRRFLLEDSGPDGIHVRRRLSERLEVVSATALRPGDDIVLAPGDLIPVDAELAEDSASISTDWVNGEPTPRRVQRGEILPAGSFNAGRRAIAAVARTAYAQSPLSALLRAGLERGDAHRHARLLTGISRYYVPAVLLLAGLAMVLWWPVSPDRALEVTVALLVVTCPCALGIAVPLGIELALAGLRRGGVFVRTGDLLDRALTVRKVLFDKTGTLTLGRLELVRPELLDTLAPEVRDRLHDMAARSNHPASRCLAEATGRLGARYSPEAEVTELPGQGLELTVDGETWRLGRASFAALWETVKSEGTVLSRDGRPVAVFALREAMRQDAAREIAALHEKGLQTWLVSGDAADRVTSAADMLGIPGANVLAAQSPEDKSAAVARLDIKDTLFVGDGVNDSLAFAAAHTTASPAVDRPVMPGKADFFLLGEGIGGVRRLLDMAHRLRGVTRRTLFLALGYNVLAVTATLLGFMTPLRAAVAMPASSLIIIAITLASLSHEGRLRGVRREGAADATQGVPAWT